MFSKQGLILSSIVLVTLKVWLVLRNKLDYTHTKIGAKVQPQKPSVLIVYPTQMLSSYDLFRIVVSVITKRRAPVIRISCFFNDQVLAKRRLLPITAESGTMFLMRGDYIWSERKTLGLKVNFLISRKKTL